MQVLGYMALQLDVTRPCHLDDVLIRVLTGKSHSDGVTESLIETIYSYVIKVKGKSQAMVNHPRVG